MNITIQIPDNAIDIVDEHCQREFGISLQQKLQRVANSLVYDMLPTIRLRIELKKDLDKFFEEFGKLLAESI